MSNGDTKHVSGNSLRRTRSAGDPTLLSSDLGIPQSGPSRLSEDTHSSFNVRIIPKSASRGPHSAGPSFNASIPEPILESPAIVSLPSSPRIPPSPPPPVLHRLPTATALNVSTNNTAHSPPSPRPGHSLNQSMIPRVLRFFGYGNNASKARRQLVSLIWNLVWCFAQIVSIIVVLATSAPKPSPTVPGVNEWTACERPLGVWSCLWLARVIAACGLAYWGWTRDRSTLSENRNSRIDPESGHSAPHASNPEQLEQIRLQHNLQRPSSSGNSPQTQDAHLRHTVIFKRLSLFSSMFSLTWFLTAHVLVYTSIGTCRFSSPHIWWLVIGILCTTYLMILEVILLGLLVFVFAPVVLLIWNIFLLCIGRHPLQNPHMIKPDIDKLPKSLVDRIPLVMYIPPPPDAPLSEGPIQIPASVYSYPPNSPVKGTHIPAKKLFRFIRFKKFSSKSAKASSDGATDSSKPEKSTEPGPWEDSWDTEGYPYVVLDDNRAACAICLLDFEEPKRLHPVAEQQAKAVSEPKAGEITVEIVAEEERENDELRLTNAGEGAQPLRLLKCGHVFHKTCLDPWLIDVSGRCPICQRPVEISELEKKKKGRRR